MQQKNLLTNEPTVLAGLRYAYPSVSYSALRIPPTSAALLQLCAILYNTSEPLGIHNSLGYVRNGVSGFLLRDL